jgi:D-glycero-D-manno-heptose 1,7-bisphosphate phosphatase
MNRAVFLDRDGVIIKEPPHYAHRLDQLDLISRCAEAIRLLNENGFTVIIASNQAGVARGYYREEDTLLFNQALKEKIAKKGAHIDAIYYCPHHPEATIERYRVDCNCRKPKPGMLARAEKELNVDLKQSFIIGDKLSDIQTGKGAGCKTIMVRTGHGADELKSSQFECNYIADDLYDAVAHILCLSHKPGTDQMNAHNEL